MSKPTKRIQQLINDLESTSQEKVLKTIAILEDEGTADVIQPLCDTYMRQASEEVKEKIENFLNKLSDSSALPAMVDALRNEDNKEMRRVLVGACWQSKLDFSDYLADFVAIASEGDFLETFECYTVIENLDGPFNESQILESQLYLKEFLETEKGKNEQVDELMSDIALRIKDFDQGIEG